VVKKEWQPSFLTQSLVLTKRSFVNMYRDLGYYWLRFAIYIALCVCVGTIFYDVGHTFGSIQVTEINMFSFNYNSPIYICHMRRRLYKCVELSLLKTLHVRTVSAGSWVHAQLRVCLPHLHGHRWLPVFRRGHEGPLHFQLDHSLTHHFSI
jgi:hypothetical protein